MPSPTTIIPLIRTKLAPPRVGRPAVGRDRILGELQARRDRGLTLILGPAGSGKTTLAALWRQRLIAEGVQVAWYNVGADDDGMQWAACWFTSLKEAGVEVGAALGQMAQFDALENLERFIALVANALYAHARPVFLILEDLHVLNVKWPFDLIERLLPALPHNAHLVLTARRPLPLNLSALRLKDQVTEINFDQLRFSPEEQGQFLDELGVRNLSPGRLRRLYALTEGWIAAAQLAGLALKKGGDFEDGLARLKMVSAEADDDGLIAYLEEMSSTILDPDQLDVLVRISACRRFNKELCSEICGDAKAGELLAVVAAQYLFLMPIESDDPQPWYRFHRIFAAFLRRRLSRLPGEQLAEINRRACLWFEKRGLITEAIRHARYAGDTVRIAELIGGVARPMLYSGQFLQLLRWAAYLPGEARNKDIEVLLSVGWSQVSARRSSEVDATLSAIAAHPAAARFEIDYEARLLRAFDLIVRDDTAQAMTLLVPILGASLPRDGFNLLMLGAVGGMALVGSGDYERARDLVTDCQSRLRSQHGARPRPYLESIAGHSFLAQGDFVQARDVMLKSLHDLRSDVDLAEYSTGYISSFMAEVSYQLDDPDAAEDYLDAYADLVGITGFLDINLYALRAKARLYALRGDRARALVVLDDMENLAQDEGWDRLAAWSLAERVRILGRETTTMTSMREALRRLRRLASRYSANSAGTLADIGLAASIAEVDAAAAEFDWSQVAVLAMPLAGQLRKKGRLFLAARQTVLAAIALQEMGRPEEALVLARGILLLAEHSGMYRLFSEEGARALRLARALSAIPDLRVEERRLLDNTLGEPAAHAVTPPPLPGLKAPTTTAVGTGPLSPKEREIVQLLGRALSIKTIARVLNVSPGTIKWHLKNVYIKLDAVSREDAVAKARALGIVA